MLTTYIAQGPRVVLSYADPKTGKRKAHVIDPADREGARLIIRTVRWAAHHRVELTIRPA